MLVQNTLIQGQHEFFKKKSKDKFNGYEYVDLGLPSGTLWAKMNVGAESETDYGLYFAWGETEGYADASTKAFSQSDYKFNPSGDGSTFTKYNTTDNKVVLDAEDDAAAVNMGGEWHMPTKDQYEELLNTTYVTNTWVTDYQGSGIKGRLFTSVSNSNTLFIPAAGYCLGGKIYNDVGGCGYINASTLLSEDVKKMWTFYFTNGKAKTASTGRYDGHSVRGVIGKIDDTILI